MTFDRLFSTHANINTTPKLQGLPRTEFIELLWIKHLLILSNQVVHLGDQLKQMDEKRKRASEAKLLMDYINEARNTGTVGIYILTYDYRPQGNWTFAG